MAKESTGLVVEIRFTPGHHVSVENDKISSEVRRIVHDTLKRGGAPDGVYSVKIGRKAPVRGTTDVVTQVTVRGDAVRLRIKSGKTGGGHILTVWPPANCSPNLLAIHLGGGDLREVVPDLDLSYWPLRSIRDEEVFNLVLCNLGLARLKGRFQLAIMKNAPSSLVAGLGRLVVIEPNREDYFPALADSVTGRRYLLSIFCDDPQVAYQALVDSGIAATSADVVDQQMAVEAERGPSAVQVVTSMLIASLVIVRLFPSVTEREAKELFDQLQAARGDKIVNWERVRKLGFERVNDGPLTVKDSQLAFLVDVLAESEFPGLPESFPDCHRQLAERVQEDRGRLEELNGSLGAASARQAELAERECELVQLLEDVRSQLRSVDEVGTSLAHEHNARSTSLARTQSILAGPGYQGLVRQLVCPDNK